MKKSRTYQREVIMHMPIDIIPIIGEYCPELLSDQELFDAFSNALNELSIMDDIQLNEVLRHLSTQQCDEILDSLEQAKQLAIEQFSHILPQNYLISFDTESNELLIQRDSPLIIDGDPRPIFRIDLTPMIESKSMPSLDTVETTAVLSQGLFKIDLTLVCVIGAIFRIIMPNNNITSKQMLVSMLIILAIYFAQGKYTQIKAADEIRAILQQQLRDKTYLEIVYDLVIACRRHFLFQHQLSLID